MRRLILLRHAKAERAAASGRDFDRPLSPRGEDDARLMGQALARAGLKPDLALVSPAARTARTWEIAAEALGEAVVETDPKLYHASPRTLRGFVEAAEDRADTVVLVGHNPGLQELALQLLEEGAEDRSVIDRVASGFPTAAALVFAVDAAGRARYDGFHRPKDYGGGADG